MKIISVNVDRGCNGQHNQRNFQKWVAEEQPNLLLVQEARTPIRDKAGTFCEPLHIDNYFLLNGADGHPNQTSRVASYSRGTEGKLNVEQIDERWEVIQMLGISIHNLYLPDGSGQSVDRADYLNRLRKRLEVMKEPALVFGDFNCVPRPEDSEPRESKNYYVRTASAFVSLFAQTGLVDILQRDVEQDGFEFTCNRLVLGIDRKFRCDLAFASEQLQPLIVKKNTKYVHATRRSAIKNGGVALLKGNIPPFTDHSAIVLELNL